LKKKTFSKRFQFIVHQPNPMPEQQEQPGTISENVVEEHHDAPTRTICIAGSNLIPSNIHPVDQSEFSKHAFQWSIDNLIKPETDQVVLLNVRPFVSSPMYSALSYLRSYNATILDIGADYVKVDEANKKQSHDLIRSYSSLVLTK
jgi:hypothetical protein